MSALSQAAWGSSGERHLPERGAGAALPVSSNRFFQRIAEDAPTLKRRAAPRRELPSAISSTTRLRYSSEYGRPTMSPSRIRGLIDSYLTRLVKLTAHHNRFIAAGQCSSHRMRRGGVAGRVSKAALFSGQSLRDQRRFALRRAHAWRGRHAEYRVELADYPVNFNIEEDEYEKLFGKRDEAAAAGLCLFAPIQQKGAALRILESDRHPIPEGQIRSCASGPADGPLVEP